VVQRSVLEARRIFEQNYRTPPCIRDVLNIKISKNTIFSRFREEIKTRYADSLSIFLLVIHLKKVMGGGAIMPVHPYFPTVWQNGSLFCGGFWFQIDLDRAQDPPPHLLLEEEAPGAFYERGEFFPGEHNPYFISKFW